MTLIFFPLLTGYNYPYFFINFLKYIIIMIFEF
jgi:hypothetical protein